MKSRHIYWIIGLMTLVSCKELTCDFTYSPTTPAAGEVISFTNTSTGADDYYWNFGDNNTSTTSSPTHIYRKPGKYTVTLQIVRNKVEKRTRTQYVTVIDTIPVIASDSSTIYTFVPIKFYARVYNPWKKTLTYQWTLPEDAVVLSGTGLDSSAVVCYFTHPGKADSVRLRFKQGELAERNLSYKFVSVHTQGRSVLYTTLKDTIEQHTYIVNKRYVYQDPERIASEESRRIFSKEQDTVYQYGGNKYTISTVSGFLQIDNIQGFQVDRLMNKMYAYSNSGLWVSGMTGLNKRQLVTDGVQALKVDGDNNCVYWATNQGLFVHRLLKTQDNQEDFVPEIVNDSCFTIQKISVNSSLH